MNWLKISIKHSIKGSNFNTNTYVEKEYNKYLKCDKEFEFYNIFLSASENKGLFSNRDNEKLYNTYKIYFKAHHISLNSSSINEYFLQENYKTSKY